MRFSNWDETNYRCTWIIGLLQLLKDYICIAPTNDTNEAFVKMNHLGFCPHYTVCTKCHTSCDSVSLIANKAISDDSHEQKHALYEPCVVRTLCKKVNAAKKELRYAFRNFSQTSFFVNLIVPKLFSLCHIIPSGTWVRWKKGKVKLCKNHKINWVGQMARLSARGARLIGLGTQLFHLASRLF